MPRLGNLSFARKLGLGFGGIICLSLCVIAVSFGYFESVSQANRISARTFEAQALRQAILTDLVDMETGKRGYALAGRDEYLAPYEAGKERFDAHLATLRQLLGESAGEREDLDALERTYRQGILPESERLIDLRRALLRFEDIGRVIDFASKSETKAHMDAVRAALARGEAGRGFAVVADEVRKLAEKSMAATRQVDETIDGIQQGTRDNVARVDEAAQAIGTVSALTRDCGLALAAIVGLAERVSGQIGGIASASEQQAASSDAVSQAVADIDRVSLETDAAMERSAGAVQGLARQAHDIRELIGAMRHDGHAPALPAGA
ncbi:MAG: methyl-accepting chemotaxis protein [Solidesulfovibrio sp. DCME]|uniref:methyl-accepting chemotaxis protein n=1 Tax=Solidesulfovibrio sp. DCME TaxID=3447380 RepID=UPI003D0E7217